MTSKSAININSEITFEAAEKKNRIAGHRAANAGLDSFSRQGVYESLKASINHYMPNFGTNWGY